MASQDTSDEDGEGYFASVSDLMVGILFVFLLMLTVFALNFREAEDKQKIEMSKYEELRVKAERAEKESQAAKLEALKAKEQADKEKKEADEQRTKNENLRSLLKQAVAQMTQDLEERQNARLRLLANLEERLRKAGIDVRIDPVSGVLRLPEQILFEKGQSTLGTGVLAAPGRQSDAKLVLTKLADALSAVLPCFTTDEVRADCEERDRATLEGVLVEGHSDRQGYKKEGRQLPVEESRDMNDRLSVERALNVFKEIRQKNGLDELRNASGFPLLAVSAYGERRPIALGSSDEDFKNNRRIDLRFILSTRTSKELEQLIEKIRPALEGQ